MKAKQKFRWKRHLFIEIPEEKFKEIKGKYDKGLEQEIQDDFYAGLEERTKET